MKNFTKIFFISLIFISVFSPFVVLATEGTGQSDPVSLTNPLPTDKPAVLIGQVINAVLGLVGSIALAMFIWGGFSWMTAGGNTEKVQKGKDIIIWATLGLVVIFFSYALVNFVIKDLIGA